MHPVKCLFTVFNKMERAVVFHTAIFKVQCIKAIVYTVYTTHCCTVVVDENCHSSEKKIQIPTCNILA